MNFTRTVKVAKVAATYTGAILAAIAVFTLYPRNLKEKEIERAKRSIAERQAQIKSKKTTAVRYVLAPMCLPPASPVVPKAVPAVDYTGMTIRDLKKIASTHKLKGYSKLNKAKLVQLITQALTP